MGARRVSPQRNPRWIEPKLPCLAAHELYRGANVIHHLRISLLARLGEPIADREPGISALGQVRAPVVERVARAAPPVAAVNIHDDRKRARSGREIEVALQGNAV